MGQPKDNIFKSINGVVADVLRRHHGDLAGKPFAYVVDAVWGQNSVMDSVQREVHQAFSGLMNDIKNDCGMEGLDEPWRILIQSLLSGLMTCSLVYGLEYLAHRLPAQGSEERERAMKQFSFIGHA